MAVLLVGLVAIYLVAVTAAVILLPRVIIRGELDQWWHAAARLAHTVRRLPARLTPPQPTTHGSPPAESTAVPPELPRRPVGEPPQRRRSDASRLVGFTSSTSRQRVPQPPPPATSPRH